jgi:hypothetical protein
VKDQDRFNKTPSTADLDEESFLNAIRESAKREVIHEAAMENAETLAKAATPGKLTFKKVWDTWKAGLLENELSMPYGVQMVYVIRIERRSKRRPRRNPRSGVYCPTGGHPFYRSRPRRNPRSGAYCSMGGHVFRSRDSQGHGFTMMHRALYELEKFWCYV